MRKTTFRRIFSAAAILLLSCSAASAGNFSAIDPAAPMTLVQNRSETTRNNDRPVRPERPQRYVCVVQPSATDNRNRPYVCRADAGRVGGLCRCSNVSGNGRLDLDD